MEFWDVVETRHSVREFETRDVDRHTIERVLHAASLAPSAKNSQPWRFHVATGKTRATVGEIMAQTTVHLNDYLDVIGPENFGRIARWYSTLGDAPVVIGVSVQKPDAILDRDDLMISIGAALENLMLAATAEGLAVCVVTFARWVSDDLKTTFGVRVGRDFVSLVVLGYPSTPRQSSPTKLTDIADWLE